MASFFLYLLLDVKPHYWSIGIDTVVEPKKSTPVNKFFKTLTDHKCHEESRLEIAVQQPFGFFCLSSVQWVQLVLILDFVITTPKFY